MKELLDPYLPDINAPFDQLLEGMLAFISDQRKRLESLILNPNVGGFECCRFNTRTWDRVIQKIYEIARHRIQAEPDIAIYPVGSYGRLELCYYSDVDMVYTSSVDLEAVYDEKTLELIRLFYDFIDGFSDAIRGLKFSFFYRPFVDIDRWNYRDITALIDMRFLAGDDRLTTTLKNTVRSRRYDISIVLDLLKAKEEAVKKSDDTVYLNQPNIKEGRGGLRTIQYALWMCGLREFVSIPELYQQFGDTQMDLTLDFMFKVRNLLHLFANAPQDVLSHRPERNDLLQQQIAQALGYTGKGDTLIYDFMGAYYSCAKYLNFKAESLTGNLLGAGIHISRTLGVKQDHIFCLDDNFEAFDANELFQLFAYFQQYDFEIDASLSTFIFTQSDRGYAAPGDGRVCECVRKRVSEWSSERVGDTPTRPLAHTLTRPSALVLEALKPRMAELMARPGCVSKALTRMHRLGIMKRMLPEFERAMMTRSDRATDPYTVGKHTLVAIEHLDGIRQAVPANTRFRHAYATELEELNAIYQQISDPSVLYMALLLHDIDKPSPEHPYTGADKARRIAMEFGFNEIQREAICFLVREHKAMIELARYYQWDEDSIPEFQQKVKSLDRLMSLYLLTYCDSKANGEQNFTPLDGDNLKRLYELTRDRFVGREEEQWYAYADADEFHRFLHQMPVSYRITHSPKEIAVHIKLVKAVEAKGSSVIHFVDKAGYTELHLCGYSRIGNMHQVSGLFFAHHIDVRQALIYTKRDTNVAVDIYRLVHHPPHLRDSKPVPLDEYLKKELTQEIRELMNHQVTLNEIFARHGTQTKRQWTVYEVKVNGTSHKRYSEIVVKGEEQIGFLYFFSGILAELGLNIEMGKCSGLGAKITNHFYLTPFASPELVHQQIMERLKM